MDRAANLQRLQRPRGCGVLLLGSRQRHLCVLHQLAQRSQHTMERIEHDTHRQQHPSGQRMDEQSVITLPTSLKKGDWLTIILSSSQATSASPSSKTAPWATPTTSTCKTQTSASAASTSPSPPKIQPSPQIRTTLSSSMAQRASPARIYPSRRSRTLPVVTHCLRFTRRMGRTLPNLCGIWTRASGRVRVCRFRIRELGWDVMRVTQYDVTKLLFPFP